jgi:hypothetical protein
LMCSMGCCNLKRKLITQNIFIGVNQRNNIWLNLIWEAWKILRWFL